MGSTSLDKLFVISLLEEKDGLQWLKLTTKTDSSGFDYIHVGFKSGLLSRMLLKDSFGQTTRLLFTDVSVHTPIADDRFEFNVPEGVDVFEEASD